jgi:hypothetical protein
VATAVKNWFRKEFYSVIRVLWGEIGVPYRNSSPGERYLGDDVMGREASHKTGTEISKIVQRTSMMMTMMIMAPVSTSH